jgi:hypothetical protein
MMENSEAQNFGDIHDRECSFSRESALPLPTIYFIVVFHQSKETSLKQSWHPPSALVMNGNRKSSLN